MENLLFIKVEIFVFILSLLYIIYYLLIKVYNIYFDVRKIIKPDNIKIKKTALNKVSLTNKIGNINEKINSKLNDDDKKKLSGILKRVKINSSKGYFDISKSLIVEGLSIDKYNKELNLELASIYEKEKNYINAEYIYKDLLEELKFDTEIMKRLGYIFALQNKFKESFNIYEKIHHKKMSDDEVIEILSDLAYNLKYYKKGLKYVNLYLTSKPRSVDKLFMKAKCLIETGKKDSAIPLYKRILELQPYNTKAKELLEEIERSLGN